MLRLAKDRDELRIVNDQIGAPTWSRLIAEVVGQILFARSDDKADWNELSGIYHVAPMGKASWYDFANEIFGSGVVRSRRSELGLLPSAPLVSAISSDSYASAAVRPANSTLNCAKVGKTFGVFLPEWRESLTLCLEDLAG
jgi:dTDP-4-dehydrorhamnose reductase